MTELRARLTEWWVQYFNRRSDERFRAGQRAIALERYKQLGRIEPHNPWWGMKWP